MSKHPLLFALPHCSNILPKEVIKKIHLNDQEVKNYLDIGSIELYSSGAFHIFPAQYSRLYCDLNRAPDHEVTPENRQGMIIEMTYAGKNIYKNKLIKKEKDARITEHDRYFNEIKKYIKKHQIQFIVSAHTMNHLLPSPNQSIVERANICLSNNDFVTCDAGTTKKIKKYLEEEGYTVSINTPFKGGYLVNSLCRRDLLPGVQIEFSFTLIGDIKKQTLDPKKVEKHKKKIEKAFLKFAQNEIGKKRNEGLLHQVDL